jgi:hypothetical protein
MTLHPIQKPYPHCHDNYRFIVAGKCDYRNQHVPTIAVDFDRVLFTHESWQGHFNVGDPIPGAKEALKKLQTMGFKIMIWTTRAQKDIIAKACASAGIPFDYINENPNQPPEINPSKPVADYYIDDRALHFRSWDQALAEVINREKNDGYYPLNPGKESPATPKNQLDNRMVFWIRHGERGTSSEVIFETLSGNLLQTESWGYSTPSDASDFSRCFELLSLIPEWKPRLIEVAEKHRHWKLIVEHWEELENLFKEAMEDKTASNPYWKFNQLLNKINKYRYAPEKFPRDSP